MLSYLVIAARCLVGAVFLIAATSKVTGSRARREFASSVAAITGLRAPLVRPVAGAVVAAEFAVCVLLAVPGAIAAGFVVAAGLLLAFAIGIAASLRRGERMPCRCFGASNVPLGARQLVRNLFLAAIAVTAAVVSTPTGPSAPVGAVVGASTGLLLGILVAVLDDIVDLFAPTRRPSQP